mgnify:CR=1 FL=1
MTEKIKKTKKVGRCKCCKAQKVPLVPDAGIKICERCVLRMAFTLVRDEKYEAEAKKSLNINDLTFIVHNEIARIAREKGVEKDKVEDAFFYLYRAFYSKIIKVDIEEKENPNNLIKRLYGEGPWIMTDPKGYLVDCTDILKRNGFKVIKLEENCYKVTRLDERGKVDGTIRKNEADAG